VITLRPTDLAREHGLSTQAVRNYEREGFIPPAERTRSDYRVYTAVHAAALHAYLSLIPAYGYANSGQIMYALNNDNLDAALTAIDRGHAQLLRDRETLDSVEQAVKHLTAESGIASPARAGDKPLGIGELAHRLGVTAATLRNWEEAGILTPVREPVTRYRVYSATDIRDAELAHLLRRGGYLLEHISTVVQQIRTAGGTGVLAAALESWQRKLTAQGLATLNAATHLSHYLSLLDPAAAGSSAKAQDDREGR